MSFGDLVGNAFKAVGGIAEGALGTSGYRSNSDITIRCRCCF